MADEVIDEGLDTQGADDAGEPTPPKPPDPMDAVKQIASEFKEALLAARTAPAPPPPAPVDDTRERMEKAEIARTKLKEEVDSLAAEGKFAEAAEHFARKQGEIAALINGPQDIEKNPLVRGAYSNARDLTELRHKDVMAKYASEVEAYVKKQPIEARIDRATWDDAVNHVKAAHFDEIMTEQVEAKLKEERDKFPFTAAGSRGSRGSAPDPNFNAIDERAVAAWRLNKDEYAKVKKDTERYLQPDGSYRNIPLIDGDGTTPGRF